MALVGFGYFAVGVVALAIGLSRALPQAPRIGSALLADGDRTPIPGHSHSVALEIAAAQSGLTVLDGGRLVGLFERPEIAGVPGLLRIPAFQQRYVFGPQ